MRQRSRKWAGGQRSTFAWLLSAITASRNLPIWWEGFCTTVASFHAPSRGGNHNNAAAQSHWLLHACSEALHENQQASGCKSARVTHLVGADAHMCLGRGSGRDSEAGECEAVPEQHIALPTRWNVAAALGCCCHKEETSAGESVKHAAL